MIRRGFSVLVGISLLLFVAIAVLWARSYRRSDVILLTSQPILETLHNEAGRTLDIYSFWSGTAVCSEGTCVLAFGKDREIVPPRRFVFGSVGWPLLAKGEKSTRLGFSFHHTKWYPRVEFYEVGIPLWALCLVTGIAPARFALKKVSRRRRERRGLCPACGYDLRASPGRCPECGAVGKSPGKGDGNAA